LNFILGAFMGPWTLARFMDLSVWPLRSWSHKCTQNEIQSLILKKTHLNNDLWVSNNIRRIIESGTIPRLCFVFLIEALVLKTILCNFKVATKQNSKITQRISYLVIVSYILYIFKYTNVKYLLNHWNGRINRILRYVLNTCRPGSVVKSRQALWF